MIHVTFCKKKIPLMRVYRILPSDFLSPKSSFASSLSFVSWLPVLALLAVLVSFSLLTALSARISSRGKVISYTGATSDYELLNRREISKIVTPHPSLPRLLILFQELHFILPPRNIISSHLSTWLRIRIRFFFFLFFLFSFFFSFLFFEQRIEDMQQGYTRS